eukprot:3362982-Pyramimonas_sp.AAC.1
MATSPLVWSTFAIRPAARGRAWAPTAGFARIHADSVGGGFDRRGPWLLLIVILVVVFVRLLTRHHYPCSSPS